MIPASCKRLAEAYFPITAAPKHSARESRCDALAAGQHAQWERIEHRCDKLNTGWVGDDNGRKWAV